MTAGGSGNELLIGTSSTMIALRKEDIAALASWCVADAQGRLEDSCSLVVDLAEAGVVAQQQL